MSGKAICVFFGSKISLNPSHTSECRAEKPEVKLKQSDYRTL